MRVSWGILMRVIAFIVAVIYLQGCTIKVLDLAKGIEKGPIQNSADVEAIWKDDVQNEFIICMNDPSKFPNKKGNGYMLRIPKNLPTQEKNKHVEFEPRTVSKLKPKEEHHWYSWSLYDDRNDIRVYDLSVVVDEYKCVAPKSTWSRISILRAPKDITPNEVFYYQGEKIKQMTGKHGPFSIFSPHDKDTLNIEFVCHNTSYEDKPCFLLISNTQIQDKENPQFHYDELLSIEQVIWTSEPKPIWYLTIPFAVAADLAIVTIILFFFGAAGTGR